MSISIHAPSRERRVSAGDYKALPIFQSTLPHGSDNNLLPSNYPSSNFNPRSLTGATIVCWLLRLISSDFNPRSLTGATKYGDACYEVMYISIHAPSRERPTNTAASTQRIYFNPRSLTGATVQVLVVNVGTEFQSTLPHGSDTSTVYPAFA